MPSITTQQLWSAETTRLLLVEPLFARSAVLPYLQRLTTDSTVLYLPRVVPGSAGWYAELSPIGASGVDASEMPVRPKKAATIETVSNESRYDAAAADVVGNALVDSLIAVVDDAFVNGAGVPEGPGGLPALTGTSSVDASPATFGAWADAITAISVAGGQATVLFVSPADWNALVKLPATSGGNVPALSPVVGPSGKPEAALFGVPVSVVPALAEGTGWAVDGTRTVVVERTPARVETNEGPAFASDGLMVRATVRLEFASVYSSTVCKVNDVP